MGLREDGDHKSYNLTVVIVYKIAFPRGRIFYEELELLLCPQFVQDMKVLPQNSMAFLYSYTIEGIDMHGVCNNITFALLHCDPF